MNKIISVAARHRALFAIPCVTIIYFIIRVFFTPALLSDVSFSRAFYDRNGELMRVTLSSDDKYRIYTPLADISPTLRDATILYEDKYFWYHPGVNPVALMRALGAFMKNTPHPAGASTITMQLARIKYDMDTRRPIGKLKQIAAALYIDAFHSKREILAAYLNLAPYGGNIEGAAAASLIYFNRAPKDISQIEAITLATIPQNPTKRGLNTDTGLANMMRMRGDLVARWIAANPDDEKLGTLADMPIARRDATDLPFLVPHFVNHEIARRDGGATDSNIHTTIDIGLQRALESRLKSEIASRKSRGITNAAAILVNYKTMEQIAHIGSVDYFDAEILGENDGVHARRSPGSTLKPLIYTMAADAGLIHSMTLLKDAKISFGVYAPENADNEFYGPVLARDALNHSRNIPAINLVRQIGVDNFHKTLADMGVANLKSPSHYGISIALGGAEVSMFELATIYATMANLGGYRPIRTRMTDASTTPIQIIRPAAYFITLDMLGRAGTPNQNIPFAKNQSRPIHHYWKTGTSSSYRDAWTAGIFGDFVLVVWVGNFDGHPNNAFSGARTAAPIYFALADTVTEYMAAHGAPVRDNNFLRDDLNISVVEMCDRVGGIANEYCPHRVPTYFIPGVSPIDTGAIYRAVPIDNKTGRRACTRDPATTHMAVFEFWDAEYIDMFERAGIHRNTPPPFMENCNLNDIVATQTPPIITSPIDGTRIVIVGDSDTEHIAMRAVTENPSARIFWFIDDEMIGHSISGETITHPVTMGTHRVRAMDEMGTGTSADFSIVK